MILLIRQVVNLFIRPNARAATSVGVRVPTDLQDHIAARLRALRTRQGLTLEALADKCGMPIETLSRIERRRIAPSIRSLSRVAAGLGVPLTALLTEDAVEQVSAEGFAPEVRGIAMRLAGQPPEVLARVRRVVDALLNE